MNFNNSRDTVICKLSDFTPEKGTRFSHYVVWNGRKPGVYESWDECSKQVNGFKNATFRGFYDLESVVAAFKRKEEGPLSIGGATRDTSSGRCPNCDYLSLKIKLLETEVAYYKEKLQNSPSPSLSNEKNVPMLIEELGELLQK